MRLMVCAFVRMCVQEVLVEQRTALSDMLQQLLKQRDQREKELRQVLVRKYSIIHSTLLSLSPVFSC